MNRREFLKRMEDWEAAGVSPGQIAFWKGFIAACQLMENGADPKTERCSGELMLEMIEREDAERKARYVEPRYQFVMYDEEKK